MEEGMGDGVQGGSKWDVEVDIIDETNESRLAVSILCPLAFTSDDRFLGE
jgi:hypothetical protein